VTKDIALGAAYTGINGGSAPINQSRLLAGTLVGRTVLAQQSRTLQHDASAL